MVHEKLNAMVHQTNTLDMSLLTSKMKLSDVFAPRTRSYLNELNLYIAHFNTIPNVIQEININCKKANLWFMEAYKAEIMDKHYNMRYFNGSKKAEYDDIFYILPENAIVNFDTNNATVRFMFRNTPTAKLNEIIRGIKNYKLKKIKDRPEMLLIVNTSQGLATKIVKIKKCGLNICDNYNETFMQVHQTIFKKLSAKNEKGIVLFHGKPGTGKTSYIRHLIASLKKDIIFLPPNLVHYLSDPDLITLLIEKPNSVLVIEDAENIITAREKEGRTSPVSALLNISDGLLSDCLNIQVICSFNTDVSKVDTALMRKGRLIASYEFKELEVAKAQNLSDKLGFCANIQTPMTLTAIYNQNETDFQPEKRKNGIGFR